MSDINYDNYRYDNNSRRTVRTNGSAPYTASPRKPAKKKASRADSISQGPSILYDARGVRVRKSRFSSEFVRTLLFFVVPYLIINAVIFIIVTATPKVEVQISDTDDYRTATAKFSVNSLLPIKDLSASLESEPIEYTKSGSSYTARINQNGTFFVEVMSVNGMRAVGYTDVNILDDTPPVIDDKSCHIEDGILTFSIFDSQAGVDFSSVYGLDAAGNRVVPSSFDKEKGVVTIPMSSDSMDLHFSDMVGNERSASINSTSEQTTVSEPSV